MVASEQEHDAEHAHIGEWPLERWLVSSCRRHRPG
jgi:hypothetical protein